MATTPDNFFPALLEKWKKQLSLDDEQLKHRFPETTGLSERFPLGRYMNGELFPGYAERHLFYRMLDISESEATDVEKRALIYVESTVHQDLFSQLCRACRENNEQLVHDLLGKGIDIHSRDGKGCTPLHHAVGTNNLALVTSLFECGASAGMLNTAGKTPMHLACETGNVEIVECCLDYGQSLNDHQLSIGRSKLDEPRLIDLFLQQGLSFETWSQSDPTPLMLLAEREHTRMMLLLLDLDIEVNQTGPDQNTALHIAARTGKVNAVRLLLSRGSMINSANTLGKTALHLAVQNQHKEAIEALLQAGANTALHDQAQMTPYSYAEQTGIADIVACFSANTASGPLYQQEGNTFGIYSIIFTDSRASVFTFLPRNCDKPFITGDEQMLGLVSVDEMISNPNLQPKQQDMKKIEGCLPAIRDDPSFSLFTLLDIFPESTVVLSNAATSSHSVLLYPPGSRKISASEFLASLDSRKQPEEESGDGNNDVDSSAEPGYAKLVSDVMFVIREVTATENPLEPSEPSALEPCPLEPVVLLYDSIGRVFSHYADYIPALIYMWIFVESAAANIPTAPEIAMAGFFIFGVPFYVAAAAKPDGLFERSVFSLGFERIFASIPILMLCVLGFAIFFGLLAGLRSLPDALLPMTFFLVGIVVFAPTWPILFIPFVYVDEYTEPDSVTFERLKTWAAFRQAFRLAKRITVRATVLFLVMLFALLTAHIYLQTTVSSASGVLLWKLFFYLVGLPILLDYGYRLVFSHRR